MVDYFSKEYEQLWKLSQHPKSFYRLLGFVFQSYAGTYRPKENILQSFISPSDKIDTFRLICFQLLEELELDNDIQIKEEGDHFVIESQSICTYLESLDWREIKEMFISLMKPPYGTYPLALNQRMEFLVGSYLFHGKNSGELIFYNNYQKASLIHQFMVEMADETDFICFTSKFCTPNIHKIELNTDGYLWKTLEQRMD